MVSPPEEPRFCTTGGALCLVFTNTLDRELPAPGRDYLGDYALLAAWGRQMGFLEPERAAGLTEAARRAPRESAAVHERAIALREAIFATFDALARGRGPAPADLAVINAEHAAAMAHARIRPGAEGFDWTWDDATDLASPLWPVARDAADLLTHPDAVRVKACAADACCALFVDTTKNRRRRWCDMKICGNRTKVRRHRERKREG